MRVGELAELAGVTVRTIRYYHQAGVLAEPPRRTNGYRVYTVDHLVALLRIRQLAESGLSLARAGAVVADSDAASGEDALDEVDRALEARIAVLTEQRRKLAEARSGRHVGLSRLAAALAVKPTDAPLAILLAHLYRDDPQAEQLADTLLSPALRSELVSLQDRFDDIDEDTPESDLDDLGEAVRRIITSISEHLSPLESEQPHLVQALADREMNDRQRSFMRRFD